MIPRILSVFVLLCVSLLTTPALAGWDRNDGFKSKPKKDSGYDEEYDKDSKKKDSSKDSSKKAEEVEAASSADEEDAESSSRSSGPGFALGARIGYALPFGKVGEQEGTDQAESLSDLVSGGIPAQLDVGYFLNSHLYVGGSFQYALMQFAEECPLDCNASQLRFGVNAAWFFNPEGTLNPWAGVGVGYETLSFGVDAMLQGQDLSVSTTLRGLEFLNLQAGVDFRLGKSMSVGPFATFTVGQYTGGSFSIAGESQDADIQNKALHFWLIGGARVLFRL